MSEGRVVDLRRAMLESTTWEESMRRLQKHGVGFRETSKRFADTTRYFLGSYESGEREQGMSMSIQRDLFAGMQNPPTAQQCVQRWGRFPADYQKEVKAAAKPGVAYKLRPIGGRRGEELHERWAKYAAGKRIRREQTTTLYQLALAAARAKSANERSREERRLISNPREYKAHVLDIASPMSFADWVGTAADKGDPDALWLQRLAARNVNVDPQAALAADREGNGGDDAATEDEGHAKNIEDERAQAVRKRNEAETLRRMKLREIERQQRAKRSRRRRPTVPIGGIKPPPRQPAAILGGLR